MWYFVSDHKPVGPISAAEIESLIRSGQITGNTFVWTNPMEDWKTVRDMAALSALLPRQPPPIRSPGSIASTSEPSSTPAVAPTRTLPPDEPLAGPWFRFLARTIDVWLTMLVAAFIIGILATAYFPWFLVWMGTANDGLLVLTFLPFAMLLTAISMAMFGTSFGKAVFGIRVRNLTQDGPLRFHLTRELHVWVRALALGIPIVALFTYIAQYRRVSAGRPASYDEGHARVEAKTFSLFRKLAAALLFVLCLGAVISLSVWDMQNAEDARTTQAWRNPVTGRSAHISNSWTATEARTNNGKVFQFTSDYFLAEALFGTEQAGPRLIDAHRYGEALEAALSDDLRFRSPWQPVTVNGRSAMRAYATLGSDSNVDIQLTVAVVGDQAWRTLIFARGRKVDEAGFGEDFVRAVFSSI